MADDSCGATTSCVWRATRKIKQAGRKAEVTDLCIAINEHGEPCGVKAAILIGQENLRYGQPFCREHATQIVAGLEHRLSKVPTTSKSKWKEEGYHPPSRKLHDDHIYFARRGDIVKIGHTRQWRVRLRALELNGGSPFDEVVIHPGGRALEARLHRKHEEHLVQGEWFEAAPEVLAEMETLAASEDAITDWRARVGDFADVGNHKNQRAS